MGKPCYARNLQKALELPHWARFATEPGHTYTAGMKLDIGCGGLKRAGYVGMDARALPGVDIVHNFEKFPWPVADGSLTDLYASHVLEHVSPASTDPRLAGLIKLLRDKKAVSDAEIRAYVGEPETFGVFLRFMDEAWRVLQDAGRFEFVVPYAGSTGFFQDPTHVNPLNRNTLAYFDPTHPAGLWGIYQPKPWKIISVIADPTENLDVVLEKLPADTPLSPEPWPATTGLARIAGHVKWRLARAARRLARALD